MASKERGNLWNVAGLLFSSCRGTIPRPLLAFPASGKASSLDCLDQMTSQCSSASSAATPAKHQMMQPTSVSKMIQKELAYPTILQPSSNHPPTILQPSSNHHPTIIQPSSNHHPTPIFSMFSISSNPIFLQSLALYQGAATVDGHQWPIAGGHPRIPRAGRRRNGFRPCVLICMYIYIYIYISISIYIYICKT